VQYISDGTEYGALVVDVEGTRSRNSKFKHKLKTTRKKYNENEDKEQRLLLIYGKNYTILNISSLFVN